MKYEYLVDTIPTVKHSSNFTENAYLKKKAEEGYRLIQVLKWFDDFKYYFERVREEGN